MPPKKPQAHPSKTRAWTLPTVLGLAIGIVGALGVTELRPQMAISPQAPLEKSQPFSVPFDLNNTGYFSFHVNLAYCDASKIVGANYEASDDVEGLKDWINVEIDRGTGGTLSCRIMHVPTQPKAALIVFVIDYIPFRFYPLHPFRKYIGFSGAYTAGIDNWQWTPYPVSDSFAKTIGKRIDAFNLHNHVPPN